jgi:hypothetical protein
MKGVAVEKIGAPTVVVDDLETPEPAADQILVKSIYTAINPMYAPMPNSYSDQRPNDMSPVMATWQILASLCSIGLSFWVVMLPE